MRGWMKALLLAALVGAVAGACARAGEIAAPDGAGPQMNGGATPPQDSTGGTTASDTTGRWGGFIGGGG